MPPRRSGRSRRRSSRPRGGRGGGRAAPARSRRSAPRRRRGVRAAHRARRARGRRARRAPAPGSGGSRGPSGRGARRSHGLLDPVERSLLRRADALVSLLVGRGDALGQGDDERAVVRCLFGSRPALDRRDRLAQPLEPLRRKRLRRAVPVPVELGLRRRKLVEQLALAVLLPSLGVRPGEGEALAEAAAALRAGDDHSGGGRAFQHGLPFLLGERALPGHLTLPFWPLGPTLASVSMAVASPERYL